MNRVDWDQSLVELTHSTRWGEPLRSFQLGARSSIPFRVVEAWSKAKQRADCGLFVEIRHAWASLDQTLQLDSCLFKLFPTSGPCRR